MIAAEVATAVGGMNRLLESNPIPVCLIFVLLLFDILLFPLRFERENNLLVFLVSTRTSF